MSSELFTKSLARGRLSVRKRKQVSGELVIMFDDPSIQPLLINTFEPVCLTDHPGVTPHALQHCTVRTLLARNLLEVVLDA